MDNLAIPSGPVASALFKAKHVKLTPQALEHLPPEAAKWGPIEFFEHRGARHLYGEAHVLKHREPDRVRSGDADGVQSIGPLYST